MTPTPFQQECLDIIDRLNAAHFGDWFFRSTMMATIQVESAFRPRATRFEPRLNEASYGLCQVLESTARSLGLVGDPHQMFDPEVSILYGMKVHRQDYDVLERRFGRAPSWEEFCDAYNRGARGSHLGDEDHAYVALWMDARTLWMPFDKPILAPVAG